MVADTEGALRVLDELPFQLYPFQLAKSERVGWNEWVNYWLFKTEPNAFSYAMLEASPNQTAPWDGVRNFQARNFLRDGVAIGDGVFIYHSSIPEPAIIGIARVVPPAQSPSQPKVSPEYLPHTPGVWGRYSAGYPDDTAWDPTSEHFDPRSSPDRPIWFMVDVQAVRPLKRPVTLAELKDDPVFANCSLVTRPRLSIHPITPAEWQHILDLADTK